MHAIGGHEFPHEMLLNNAIVGICFVVRRRILWANPRMAEILGYEQVELQGFDVRRLYASDADYERDGALYAKMARHNRYVHEPRLLTKRGEELWCMLSGRMVNPSDAASPSVWVLQDVSDRKRAQAQILRTNQRLEETVQRRTRSLQRSNESLHLQIDQRHRMQEAMRESREKYRALFRSLPLGVLVLNDQHEVVESNRALQGYLGAVGKAALDRALADPGRVQLPSGTCSLMELLRTVVPQARAPRAAMQEFVWLGTRGQRRQVTLLATPMKPPGLGVVYTLADVTAQRQAVERQREQREALAHAARLSLMGEMASALAHELGQPLNACQSYVAGLTLRLREGTAAPATLQHALDKMDQHLGQAADIIRNVRSFVSRQPHEMQTIDLGELVQRTLALLEPQLRAAGVRRRVELPDGRLPVRCNPVEIQQVLVNLMVNAIEAMHRVPAEERLLELAVRRERGGMLGVTITDHGEGISAEHAIRLFEPYFTTKQAGLGMGLMICRNIVESHGGSIRLVPGKIGASFRFTLRSKD
jgi:PAS domain S-box-containing protein